MLGVTVPVVHIIHVISVGHSFMPAAFGVHVGVVLMDEMRQHPVAEHLSRVYHQNRSPGATAWTFPAHVCRSRLDARVP